MHNRDDQFEKCNNPNSCTNKRAGVASGGTSLWDQFSVYDTHIGSRMHLVQRPARNEQHLAFASALFWNCAAVCGIQPYFSTQSTSCGCLGCVRWFRQFTPTRLTRALWCVQALSCIVVRSLPPDAQVKWLAGHVPNTTGPDKIVTGNNWTVICSY